MKKYLIPIFLLVLAFYVLAGIFYPQMPETMASHWNAAGEADGYTGRFWGMFLFPFIVTGISLLLLAVPYIDPLKANIGKFIGLYGWFIILFQIFFLYIYVLSILWNLDYRFDMTQLLMPATGFLFVFVGILLMRSKRNYMIGIRTPWTLANDEVWDRTHRLGGRLFIAAGILTVLSVFWPGIAIWVLMGGLLVATLISLVYSYWVFQQVSRPVIAKP
jgi:uncharacterized membrane protein